MILAQMLSKNLVRQTVPGKKAGFFVMNGPAVEFISPLKKRESSSWTVDKGHFPRPRIKTPARR
jgi:hypothetical protein